MTHLTPTAAPVPDSLPAAFGYEGEARYFAAYWLPGGDELMLADGQVEFTAYNWHAWLIYRDHPAVAPHLFRYNFGSSDEAAEHWLLIDRAERKAHVAPVAEARAFLRAQWPEAEPVDVDVPALTAKEFLAQFKAAIADWQATHSHITPADIWARMETEAALCRQMQAELNTILTIAQQ